MERNLFFGEAARREVAAAVKHVESTSSAELVVAVRYAAGRYRHADYLAGALGGFGMLLVLLFHPHPFAVSTMPLDVAVVFAVAAFACSRSPFMRRLLSSPGYRAEEMRRAARSAFVDLGVSKTRGRTGILIYVAMLERSVQVVSDVGVPDCLDLSALRAAVLKEDLAALIAALRALAAPLEKALPRAEDDVNELPDELTAE